MRFVIYGAGAIGGVIGARLHQAGRDVLLIARGAHGEALAADGLTLITPEERVTLRIPVTETVQAAGITPDDVVLLTVKGQDTAAALDALAQVAGADRPVVLGQNGVANEHFALRLFENVYGMVVLLPATHLEPGVVVTYGTRFSGTLDIGRYPTGIDERAESIAAALRNSRFEATARPDIMTHKYAKLIANLGNAVQAICGTDADTAELTERVRAEGRAILDAAGIPHQVDDVADMGGRWKRWGAGEVPGYPRGGGSTWQSVTRGAGHVETDYLNGEIVLQGRLLGIDAPLNQALQERVREAVRDGHTPGWRSPESILADVGQLA
jgi:2-dehydropantoate 2-reductase